MIIILGIDPGLCNTGYGIISVIDDKISYLNSGCIRTKKENILLRLKFIYKSMNKLIKKYKPNYIVIEKVFIGKYLGSVIKLIKAKAIIVLSAIMNNLDVTIYNFNIVKKAIGTFNKNKLYKSIKQILNLSKIKKISKDALDALSFAVTYYYLNFKNWYEK